MSRIREALNITMDNERHNFLLGEGFQLSHEGNGNYQFHYDSKIHVSVFIDDRTIRVIHDNPFEKHKEVTTEYHISPTTFRSSYDNMLLYLKRVKELVV